MYYNTMMYSNMLPILKYKCVLKYIGVVKYNNIQMLVHPYTNNNTWSKIALQTVWGSSIEVRFFNYR